VHPLGRPLPVTKSQNKGVVLGRPGRRYAGTRAAHGRRQR